MLKSSTLSFTGFVLGYPKYNSSAALSGGGGRKQAIRDCNKEQSIAIPENFPHLIENCY